MEEEGKGASRGREGCASRVSEGKGVSGGRREREKAEKERERERE